MDSVMSQNDSRQSNEFKIIISLIAFVIFVFGTTISISGYFSHIENKQKIEMLDKQLSNLVELELKQCNPVIIKVLNESIKEVQTQL